MSATYLEAHSDDRGSFVELFREASGQVSFSTSAPGVTRGNHYHTRKTEKFAVIAGEAVIRLRHIDSDDIAAYYVTGDEPTIVEIRPNYIHNITATGHETMYLVIWCNEAFDPNSPDTTMEKV